MDGERGLFEIWASVLWTAVDLAERGGLPAQPLLEGLPFDKKTYRRLGRVDWIDYCTVVERIEEQAGGPEACERLLASSLHVVATPLSALARAVISPKDFYRAYAKVIAPILLPPLRMDYEDLGGDDVRVSVTFRPGARSCLAWCHASTGAVRGFTQHLGLPQATILHTDVGPRHGSWKLRVPPSQTLRATLGKRAATALLGYDETGNEVTAYVGNPGDSDVSRRLRVAGELWSLTPRQLDVLELVVRGDANKDIARSLDCAESTVELHVTQLLKKSGSDSRARVIARFWTEL